MLGRKFQDEKWVLLPIYLCDMMAVLNTLNKLMQRECHTVIDFSDKVRTSKEKSELWYVKVENKKFAFLPILNRSIEDLNSEPDLKTSVLFVILEDLHTPRKKFKKYNSENINFCTWIKNLFSTNVADFDARFPFGFQEQLIDLKKDSSMNLSFEELSLPKFWWQVPNEYSILYKEALKIIR